MKVIRYGLVPGIIFFIALFLLPAAGYSQQLSASAYLFVEVKDTAGQPITDAQIQVTNHKGAEILTMKSAYLGLARALKYPLQKQDTYNLKVSKSGYVTAEQVFFTYACCGMHDAPFATFAGSINGSRTEYTTIRVRLTKTPVTAIEKEELEVEEQKRQFILVVKRNDLTSVNKFLRQKVDPNTSDPDGTPAITWAAFTGDPEMINALLQAGAKINQPGSLSNYALLIYISIGLDQDFTRTQKNDPPRYDSVVETLVKAGGDVNARGSDGMSVLGAALYRATWSFSAATIRLLISAGARTDEVRETGYTMLMWATVTHSAEIIKIFIDAHVPVNAKSNDGQTALMVAASNGNTSPEIIKLLLDAGADLKLTDNKGRNALDIAREYHNNWIIPTLERAFKQP